MRGKFSMITLALAMCAIASTGCASAITDGVFNGITNGIAGGIASLISNALAGFTGG